MDDRNAAIVGREVPHVGAEVSDAGIAGARVHRRVRQLGDRVMEPEEQAADVGHRGGWVGSGLTRLGNHDAGERVVRRHVERDEVRLAVHFAKRRVAGIERIGLAIGLLEPRRGAGQVGEEERVGLDQHRLALRMRL